VTSFAVRLRSAVCLVDRFPALAGVDLDVATGEVVLLSGGNGAGKTTLMRLVAGLLPLTSGEGTVLGHDLRTDRRGARRRLALMGHATACYDDLTVRENLRFAARACGRGAAAAAVAEAALTRVGLDDRADVVHLRLSAGQRRRLALAVVLVRDAELLLLDEPHAGLDAAGREVLDGVIAEAAAGGRTVLVSSHELDRVRPLATREVVMVAGQARRAPGSAPAPAPDQAALRADRPTPLRQVVG
jgi:heme ABC exporter ATP-binding subunit CcmA